MCEAVRPGRLWRDCNAQCAGALREVQAWTLHGCRALELRGCVRLLEAGTESQPFQGKVSSPCADTK